MRIDGEENGGKTRWRVVAAEIATGGSCKDRFGEIRRGAENESEIWKGVRMSVEMIMTRK